MSAIKETKMNEVSNRTVEEEEESNSSRECLEESVPATKKALRRNICFSTRGNSGFKWQDRKSVVGALEVPSDPFLDTKGKFKEHVVMAKHDDFNECLKIWGSLKLKKEFIDASAGIPPATYCCGLLTDHNKTIRELACLMNRGWVKNANKKLKPHGFKLDCFVWSWNNAHGKAVTNVLMIRFHSLSIRKLQAVSGNSSSTTCEESIIGVHENANNPIPSSDSSKQ